MTYDRHDITTKAKLIKFGTLINERMYSTINLLKGLTEFNLGINKQMLH